VFAAPNELQQKNQIERLRRGYAAEVRYTDGQIGRLLAAWDERAAGRENLVVFTADHGESLGEHSYVGHSFYLYQEELHVPLVLRMESRLRAGRHVSSVTSVVDLGATILDLLGVAPPPGFGGTSLMRWLEGPDPSPESFAIAERPPLPGATKLLREGRTRPDDWKPHDLQDRLIKRLEGRAGGGELGLVAWIHEGWKYVWSEDAPDELYSLQEDPYELDNRLEDPALEAAATALRESVESWRDRTPALHRTPKSTPEEGARTREMLDALGYVDGSGDEDE
jgi:arylsulfatase A-like enzyme